MRIEIVTREELDEAIKKRDAQLSILEAKLDAFKAFIDKVAVMTPQPVMQPESPVKRRMKH